MSDDFLKYPAVVHESVSREESQRPLLRVNGLRKYFPVYGKGLVRKKIDEVRAVDDISFDLYRGETLGLVGESGSGKTTCARVILRALEATAGSVFFDSSAFGEVNLMQVSEKHLKLLRREMQMVFQDPFSSLNPRMTVGDIIGEPLRIHRMASGKELDGKVIDLLEKVGLKREHMERYPHAFSGGQRQRIGIARALIMKPSLIVADEAVSALDVSVQAQVINLLQDLQDEFDLTTIFVAHDLSVVRHICDRVAVMFQGKIVEIGPTESIFEQAEHPYTRRLLASIPSTDPDVRLDFSAAL
ncbi:MAG: ABC transporter ATP-binding protein [Opitutaceae bacterium]|nr:ABC transporter ATP-binding protein [Opitutaceae bacterium]